MAANRNAMLFCPQVGPGRTTSARGRAREQRQLEEVGKKRGPLGRWLKRKAATRVMRKRAQRRSAKRAARGSAQVLRAGGAISKLGGRALGALGRTPWGIVAAGVAVGAVVAARLISGRTFEGMGQDVRNALLGDIDDEAQTDAATRASLGSSEVMQALSLGGKGTQSQLKSIFDMQRKQVGATVRGMNKIREDERFQVNGMADLMVMNIGKMFTDAWNAVGGPNEMDRVQDGIKRARMKDHWHPRGYGYPV